MKTPRPRQSTASKRSLPMPRKTLLTRTHFACGRLVLGLLATLRRSSVLASAPLFYQQEQQQQEDAMGEFLGQVKAASQEQRQLQSSCAVEKAFTVTSSVLSLTDGCYFHYTTEDDKDVYIAETSFVSSTLVEEKASNEYWALVENEEGFRSSSGGDIVCLSSELFEDVAHPADATWECDVDGDQLADNLTTAEFSTSCGCPDTPAPTSLPPTVLPENGTCGEPDEILVTSTLYPELEGCYGDTNSTHLGLPIYSMNGTYELDQDIIFAQEQDGDSSMVNWIMIYQPTDPDDFVLFCESGEKAGDVHPSEVETWFCNKDDDETTKPVDVSKAAFDVLCGCTLPNSSSSSAQTASSTPAPSTITINIPTPPPVSASSSFKCGVVEDEFQIISTEVDEINGECFIAAPGTSVNDMTIYTPNGEGGAGQFAIAAMPDENNNLLWVIAFLAPEEDHDIYYVSKEEATAVHPTEATWVFAVLDSGEWTYQSTDVVVACGCSELSDVKGGSNITSPLAVSIALPAMLSGIIILIFRLIF